MTTEKQARREDLRRQREELFEFRAKDPKEWLLSADSLKRSAVRLREAPLRAASELLAEPLMQQAMQSMRAGDEPKPFEWSTETESEAFTRRVFTLNTEMRGFNTSLLLDGFALENLVKGFLVMKMPIASTGGTLDPSLTQNGHALLRHFRKGLELATSDDERSAFTLDEEELAAMEVLVERIRWSGRYPVAREVEGMLPTGSNSESPSIGGTLGVSLDVGRIIDRVYDRIRRLLPKHPWMEQ